MQLTDKYGLSAAVARKRAGLPPLHNLSIKGNQETSSTGAQVAVAPSESKSIGKIRTLGQKPTFYPEIIKDLMFEKCEFCGKCEFCEK